MGLLLADNYGELLLYHVRNMKCVPYVSYEQIDTKDGYDLQAMQLLKVVTRLWILQYEKLYGIRHCPVQHLDSSLRSVAILVAVLVGIVRQISISTR